MLLEWEEGSLESKVFGKSYFLAAVIRYINSFMEGKRWNYRLRNIPIEFYTTVPGIGLSWQEYTFLSPSGTL